MNGICFLNKDHSKMNRCVALIIVFVAVGVPAEDGFSEEMKVCNGRDMKSLFNKPWQPQNVHEYSFPHCRNVRIGIEKSLCLSKELGLIVANCPVEMRFFRQLSKLHEMTLDGVDSQILELSVHGCFVFGLRMERISYERLFSCLSKQEYLLKGPYTLFETIEM